MALSEYPNISKSIKLDDGTQYAYVYIEPATSSKPTFLFLHGFPSSSYDWRHQIEAFRTKGFGILAPDLLGYGDSDSPSAVEPYALKRMSDHLAEILVKQGVRKVIGVGHDWGSAFLSRFYTWHSEFLLATIFLAVGYVEPTGAPVDVGKPYLDPIHLNAYAGIPINILDGVIALTQQLFGYPTFGYWKLFNTEEAGKLLDSHSQSASSLFYPQDPEIWKEHFGPVGAAEAWISSNKITPPPAWLTAEEIATHTKILAQKGYVGPLNWYKSAIRGGDVEFEASLPEERKHVKVPTLFVLAKEDYVGRPEIQKRGATWIQNLRIEEFPCGHWVQLEMPDKLNDLVLEFVSGL